MNVKSLLILSLSSIFLSGCASFSLFGEPDVKPIEVKTVQVERTRLNIQDPKPLKPKDVKWFVITPENAEETFAKLESEGYSVVLYGLTDDGYQNLSVNIAQLRKYIIQQRAVIQAYKDYYEPPVLEEDPK